MKVRNNRKVGHAGGGSKDLFSLVYSFNWLGVMPASAIIYLREC